jgi:serine/threonine protein kinase
MTISAGTRLGAYQIVAPIGAGGMGEVYRATDIKLGREVALKVLPEAFTRDTDRLARFEREARLLAALNHPHIAAIYGLERSGGVPFLVLELVPGPTLAELLAAEKLEIPEAMRVCKQIAEALESAHQKGIVHRDLKPANIMVTAEGNVKVLDFGLAKAFRGDGQPENSPTVSLENTREGAILGTARFMSPEQARRKTVDKRADIWDFGVVLYEMLTKKQLFGGGETITDTPASVIKDAPDLNALPAGTYAGTASARALPAQGCEDSPLSHRRSEGVSECRDGCRNGTCVCATARFTQKITMRRWYSGLQRLPSFVSNLRHVVSHSVRKYAHIQSRRLERNG